MFSVDDLVQARRDVAEADANLMIRAFDVNLRARFARRTAMTTCGPVTDVTPRSPLWLFVVPTANQIRTY